MRRYRCPDYVTRHIAAAFLSQAARKVPKESRRRRDSLASGLPRRRRGFPRANAFFGAGRNSPASRCSNSLPAFFFEKSVSLGCAAMGGDRRYGGGLFVVTPQGVLQPAAQDALTGTLQTYPARGRQKD